MKPNEVEYLSLSGSKGGEAEGGDGGDAGGDVSNGGEDGGNAGSLQFQAKVGDTEYNDPAKMAEDYAKLHSSFQETARERAELRKQLEAASAAKSTPASNSNSDSPSEPSVEEQRAYIKEKFGFLSEEDVDNKINTILGTQRVIQKIEAFVERHDGSDGFPKADNDELVKFMDERQMINPEEAYFLMHRTAIAEKYARDAAEGKTNAPATERKATGSDRTKSESKKVAYNDADARAQRRAEIANRYRT